MICPQPYTSTALSHTALRQNQWSGNKNAAVRRTAWPIWSACGLYRLPLAMKTLPWTSLRRTSDDTIFLQFLCEYNLLCELTSVPARSCSMASCSDDPPGVWVHMVDRNLSLPIKHPTWLLTKQYCYDTAVISDAEICMFLLHSGSCVFQAQKQRLHVDT